MNNSSTFKANFSTVSSVLPTRLPTSLAIFVVSFMTVSIMAGAVGNARVCILLRRRQNLRKVPHYLLGSLALTGLLSAIFDMPLIIFMTVVNYFQSYDLSFAELLCKAKLSSTFGFIVLNAMNLSLMAFDRHDCVLRPFNRRLTPRNVKKVIPVPWFLACVVVTILAVLARNESSACVTFYPYNNIAGLNVVLQAAMGAFGQFDTITIIVIVVSFVRISKRLRSSPVAPSNSAHQQHERKLTELTFKICGIFRFFRIPVMICHLLAAISVGKNSIAVNTALMVAVSWVNVVFVLNPVVHQNVLNVRPPNQAGATCRQVGH